MSKNITSPADLPPETREFYREAMNLLNEGGIPFLVAGAYAFGTYTNIFRHTKDFDLIVSPEDVEKALAVLTKAGYETEVRFTHWLAKAYYQDESLDLIFRSGNGLSVVDETWFNRAETREVLGMEALLCPVEEIIWTKAFIMERERFDGADVMHLLHCCAEKINWDRLLSLFGPHWRILLVHLILFEFVYPGERDRIPREVRRDIIDRLRNELDNPPANNHLCQGTIISRAQYLVDIQEWGYKDARLYPPIRMTEKEIAEWTEGIKEDGPDANNGKNNEK